VYLSSCIGKSELPSGTIKTVKNGKMSLQNLWVNHTPDALIRLFKLDKPIFAKMCFDGLFDVEV
nr:hypothetical protein [Alphaproteobacteria bacterium]